MIEFGVIINSTTGNQRSEMDVESESFYLATVTIKGRYVSIPIVKRFQPKKNVHIFAKI